MTTSIDDKGYLRNRRGGQIPDTPGGAMSNRTILLASTLIVCALADMGTAQAQTTRYYAREYLPNLKNNAATAPATPTPTPTPSGSYKWDDLPFGEWSSTCSATATRTKPVNCVDAQNTTVGDAMCVDAGAKPTASEGPKQIVTDCSAEIKNGSFENDGANWSLTGDASIRTGNATAGVKALRLFSQGDPGEARQVFATIPGVTYTLSFKGYREGYLPNTPYYAVSDSKVGTVKSGYLSGSDQTGNKVYLPYSMTWKAVGPTATIYFWAGTRGGYYIMFVDDVKLSAVP